MKTILGILLLAIIALAGHRKSFAKVASLRGGPSFFLTGTEFLIIGYLLSDAFLGILDNETLMYMRPFLILGLGWIGLISGLQLEWSTLRVFSRSSYLWTLLHSAFVLAVVFGGLFVLMPLLFSSSPALTLSVAVLSVAALCTAQTSLALRAQHLPEDKRPLGKVLQFVSSLNDVIAIGLFGILLAFYGIPGTWEGIPLFPWERLLFSLLLGILMGILLLMLFRTRLAEVEKVVVVIGMVLFGGGMAYLLRISPLLIYLIAGLILANFSLKSDETLHLLLRIERPLYLIFLMIAGAYLQISSPLVLVVALLYTFFRALSQGIGGGIFLGRVFQPLPTSARFLGCGLLSQAGIAVALAVHFRLWIVEGSSFPIVRMAFSALLLAILFNELLSPLGFSILRKEK